jgi:hypothetical protein
MGAVLPVNGPPVEETDVRLLDEISGLPFGATFIGEEAARDFTKFLLNGDRNVLTCDAISLTPSLKQVGQIGSVAHQP